MNNEKSKAMESGDDFKKDIKIEDEKFINNSSILSLCLKIYVVLVCIFLFSTQINWTDASFFDWIWPNRNYNYKNEYQTNLPAVPFEISETNDRFITDTSKVLGIPLSEVDFCQQRVILSLKTSCKILTGDELGKLAVALLNCQNSAESQPTIECTQNMQLSQCIGQMSSENIAVYNQILSRSKQVCLTIRQEQFRGMAELTVNRLVDSAHQHLGMVERLKNSQIQLEKATLSSIEEVTDNQLQLMEKQQDLLKIADTQRITIESNLREMQREKNFIRSGQIELTTFMTNLKQKFNEGLTEIHDKNTKAKVIFEELFKDIAKLNDVSDKIAIRLESVSQLVFDKNRETSQQFHETLIKLKDANDIVQNFSNILEKMKNDFNEQVTWLEKYMGNKVTLQPRLSVIIIHVVYMLIGMIFLVFINADVISRLLFVISIGINFLAVVNEQIKLNMILLTQTICILLLVNRLMKFLNKYVSFKGYKLTFKKNNLTTKIDKNNKNDKVRSGVIKTEAAINQIEYNNNDNTCTNNNNQGNYLNSYSNNYNDGVQNDSNELRSTTVGPRESFIRAPNLNLRSVREETPSERSSTSSRSITPLDMGRCKAITRSGTQCQFMTASLQADFCRIHDRICQER